jgi:general nucleoside transport system ATP-binding protein
VKRSISQFKAAGCGVLLVSEDLDELLKLSDRVQVIAKGQLSPSLEAAHAHGNRLGFG